jgi:hypothetical protein
MMTSDFDDVSALATENGKNTIFTSTSLSGNISGWPYPGEITYGGINEDQCHGDLRYLPLSDFTDLSGLRDPYEDCLLLLNGTRRAEVRAMSWGSFLTEYQSLADLIDRFDTAEPYIYLLRYIWNKSMQLLTPSIFYSLPKS